MASMAPHLAEVASLVGDPARANILSALMDNRALIAKELAFAARGFIILEPEGAQVRGRGMDFFDELGLETHLLSERPATILPALFGLERAALSLAGRLGALLLGFCLEHRWLERRGDSRALQITELGARQFAEVFQIEHPPLAMV